MSETAKRMWQAASISSLATIVVGCSASHSNNEVPSTPSATVVPSSLSPEAAYNEAHCQNMQVAPSALGRLTVTISGYAEVPADYGVVITTNPDTSAAASQATVFRQSQAAHDETISGIIDLGDQTQPTTFEIVGVVTPHGYAGAIATSPNCDYVAAFSPYNTSAAPSHI